MIQPLDIPQNQIPPVQYTSALLSNSGKKGVKLISRLVISWGIADNIDGTACEGEPALLANKLQSLITHEGQFFKHVADSIAESNAAQVVIFIPDFYPQWKSDFDYYFFYERLQKQVDGMKRQIEVLIPSVKVFIGHIAGEKQGFRHDNPEFIEALYAEVSSILQVERLESKDSQKELFGLTTADAFFDRFAEKCGFVDKQFIWKKELWENKHGETKSIRHVDTDMFMIVAGKYILRTVKDIAGQFEIISYDGYDKTSLDEQYGKLFKFGIKRYHGFINEPDFTENYKRVHFRKEGQTSYTFYNVAEPIKHKAKKGEFPNCVKFFKHLFGGNGTIEKPIVADRFTMFIDWLKICFQFPKQKLPMIILASAENNTGKSTLLDFLLYIFGNNAIKTDMEDIMSRFNPHNAYKKFKLLEEVWMDGDKNVVKNRLKDMITSQIGQVEAKGVNKQIIENHATIIAASNHEDNVMKLEADDTRFWVIKPPTIPMNQLDINLFDKMKAEVPALLYYLENDPITYPRSYRTWFKPEHIQTPEFWKIVEHTKPHAERAVEEFMRDLFITYRITSVRMYPEYLEDYFKKRAGFNYTQEQIKAVFKKKGYPKLSDNGGVCKIPDRIDQEHETDPVILFTDPKTGKLPVKRYYATEADKWCTEEEMKIVHTPLSIESSHTTTSTLPQRPPIQFAQTKAPF